MISPFVNINGVGFVKKENKLDRNNVESILTLTSMQKKMLLSYIRDDRSDIYHEQLSLTIRGDMKIDILKTSWQAVIENNEMLRTVFRWKEISKPVQIVLKKHEVPVLYMDFSEEEDKMNAIENIKFQDITNRIDITRETLRIYLCKMDDFTHEMIISNHHILFDGWSNGIILKELMEVYSSLYEGKVHKRLYKTKFNEFIKFLNSKNEDDEKAYWSDYLKNIDNSNDYFSCDEKGRIKEISYKINVNKTLRMKEFAKENRVLLSSMLYGVWGVLLQKLSNSNEILFGTTVSGRPENIKDVDNMVGLFINTIPLVVKTDNDTTFIELIQSLDKALNERKNYENTSLFDIKENCGLSNCEELFNSVVIIENYPLDFNSNKKMTLAIDAFSIIEKFDYNMVLQVLTFDDFELKFIFNSEAIDNEIVKKLGNYYEIILNILLKNPFINIEDVDFILEVSRTN
ncbi:hypothetical protein bsdE14_37000 [Clostridium omnivorum]|uniref:Condensation domain-containing protein n=1 Tax=Clostridium omnivorum TaxID=1604902 RepID=A0ABQ5NB66_9CLOT|nr:hypothetical protein bsdE14_37000 [Clostridium sp. E14]